jgi:hypothetical protein
MRELWLMQEARLTAEWWHTARILAAMASWASGKPQRPVDFHPLVKRKRVPMTREEFLAQAPAAHMQGKR